MKFIIEKEWLFKHLHEPSFRIVDCRFSLADSKKGNREFDNSHLPGAVFFDLETDLSGSVGEHGGRHPLPDMYEFVQKLERVGLMKTPLWLFMIKETERLQQGFGGCFNT